VTAKKKASKTNSLSKFPGIKESVSTGYQKQVPQDDALADLDEMIKMVGDSPAITRIPTGLPWMEWACGGGFPERTMVEFYGPPKSFKSTTAEYLAGRYAQAMGGNIVLLEFEHMEPRQVQLNLLPSGFRGEVYNVPATAEDKGKVVPMGDEERLRAFRSLLLSDGYAAGLLDPIGSFIPTAEEEENSMDEAHQGLWARQAAKYSRAQVKDLRVCEHSFSVFVVNHEYTMMDGRGRKDSPGHRWKHALGLRIQLHKWYSTPNKKGQSGELEDGSWIIGAEVVENKFGASGREFSYLVKAGRGVHPGLSAMHACMALGIASSDGGRVSLDGKSYGYFKRILQDQWKDEELFSPFYAAIDAWKDENMVVKGKGA